MNNVTVYQPTKSVLDEFIESEARTLGLPEEFIQSAVYVGKSNKILYFGQGYLAILALVASNLNLGVMEFQDFKFKLFDTDYAISKQAEWKAAIFEKKGNGIKTQAQSWVDLLDNYHILSPDNIIPTRSNIKTLEEFADSEHCFYVPKDLPLIQSCHVDWKIYKDGGVAREGSSCYSVNYKKTKLSVYDKSGERGGASNYLIGTMVTRTKIAAHNHAFGNSSHYLMKLCKLKNHYDDDELVEETTITSNADLQTQTAIAEQALFERKRAILANSITKNDVIDEIKKLSV